MAVQPEDLDLTAWKRNLQSYLSHVDNRKLGRAIDELCRAGCDRGTLLDLAFHYSRVRNFPGQTRTRRRAELQFVRMAASLRASLQQAASALDCLKGDSDHGPFVACVEDALWGGDFRQRAVLMAGLLGSYSGTVRRSCSVRTLASNDFLLGCLCEYVLQATGRKRRQEVAWLLEAAFAAHGVRADWTADAVGTRIRRLSPAMRHTVSASVGGLLTRHETPPKNRVFVSGAGGASGGIL